MVVADWWLCLPADVQLGVLNVATNIRYFWTQIVTGTKNYWNVKMGVVLYALSRPKRGG